MEKWNLFETFCEEGAFWHNGKTEHFKEVAWKPHPIFEGVELKNIVGAEQTKGLFSYHLVKIAPCKKIGCHAHATQLETHEVIKGKGHCLVDGEKIAYKPGVIVLLEKEVPHEVQAGEEGLYLFAKFIPALS